MKEIKLVRDFEFVGFYTDKETNSKIEVVKSKNFFNVENTLAELIRKSVKAGEKSQPVFTVVQRLIAEKDFTKLVKSIAENKQEYIIEEIYYDKKENAIKCTCFL